MSYPDIEARQKTLLQALSQFADDEVTRGDFAVIDQGKNRFAVLVPGPFSNRPFGGAGESIANWTTFVFVFERVTGVPGDAMVGLETTRQEIVDMYRKYPTLNHLGVGTLSYVTLAVLEEGDEVLEVGDGNAESGPYFYLQVLRVSIQERVGATGGEFHA